MVQKVHPKGSGFLPKSSLLVLISKNQIGGSVPSISEEPHSAQNRPHPRYFFLQKINKIHLPVRLVALRKCRSRGLVTALI